MQIQVEPTVMSDLMICITCLVMFFGYFVYRITSKLIDRETHKQKLYQYSTIFKEHEKIISSAIFPCIWIS